MRRLFGAFILTPVLLFAPVANAFPQQDASQPQPVQNISERDSRNLNVAVPGAITPEVNSPFAVTENKLDLARSTRNSVEKAKSILRRHYEDKTIEFLVEPVWFDFTGSDDPHEFYAVSRAGEENDSPWCSLDIFSIRDAERRIYHAEVLPKPNIALYKLNERVIFIWRFTEGSGAYLEFAILGFKDNAVVESAKSKDFDPPLMQGAYITKSGSSVYLRTQSALYKLEMEGDRTAFSLTNLPPPILPRNAKTLLIKATEKDLNIYFDGEPVRFVESEGARDSLKTYKVNRFQNIFLDDSFKGSIAPDTSFRVLVDSDCWKWKKSKDGFHDLMVPKKKGNTNIHIQHEDKNYHMTIEVK